MKKLDLTEREVFACWTAVCSGSRFYKDTPYTATLKYKLYNALGEEKINILRKKYEL